MRSHTLSIHLEFIPTDIALDLDRHKVCSIVTRHVKSAEAFERLYEHMQLPPRLMNMPYLAGIDLWLLTCHCSWKELAWTFYRCQLPAAVVEVKDVFIEVEKGIDDTKMSLVLLHILYFVLDESFNLENICDSLTKMKNEEQMLSFSHTHAHEDRLEDCMKSHPCLSWSVLISTLLRAKEREAAIYILHNFPVKGYLLP